MNILGIICEYNPLHNGHKYQLTSQKARFHADGVVCIMSGSFVQRGAPAIFDKWRRAEMAVLNGADLVLELPVVYAAQSASRFATGAVSILDALGAVSGISFGSECGDLDTLQKAAHFLETDKFNGLLKDELKKGVSFPAAKELAFKKAFPGTDTSLFSLPNNILGIEYLRALNTLSGKVTPITHKREETFASASRVRKKIKDGEDVSGDVPKSALPLFKNAYDKAVFDTLVTSTFRQKTAEELKEIADVSEGLELRFLKGAKETFGADALSEFVKSKRYTKTRIDRIIINTLLGITKEDLDLPPQYVRVLAFNDTGAKMLREISKKSSIPVITKMADAVSTSDAFSRLLELDLRATDLYSLLTEDKRGGKDFLTSPIYIK